MENNINTIDLINAYIDNTLSNEERFAFKNRLETDTGFNTLYIEQLAIIEGVKRVEVGREIQAARQGYIRGKWFKYIGVFVGVVLVSALVYSFIFKTEDPQIVEPTNNNEIEVVIDSMVVKKASDEKIETQNIVEQSKVETALEAEETFKLEEDNAEAKDVFEEEKTEVVENELEIKTPEPLSPELKAFYSSVKKAPQIIEVNTEKHFTVTCKEGTVLTIPAKSFVDIKTGRLARGKINLEVTEYYKLSDMLLANLTTKSDDKQLETGGMLYIDANKKDKKLRLKKGKRIQVAFNSSGKKNMQLFSGEENNDSVNWKLQDQLISNIKEIVEEDVEVSFSLIEEVPIYPGCEDGDNDMRRKCMSDKVLNFVSNNFNKSIAEDLGLTGLQKINMFFEIDKEGNIGKIYASASRKELGEEAVRVVESMPKLKPGKQRGHLVRTTFFLPFSIALEGKTIKQVPVTVRSDRKFSNEFERRMDSTKSILGALPITNNDIERYAFSTSKLGWLNCDRFARTTSKKVKYKFKLKDSNGASVKMVFKSMRSILPSVKRNSNYEFGWVPKGEEVILIAIKWKDNKLYLGKKEVNTKTVSELDLNFKEVTVHELKRELETLDKGFN